MLGFLKRIFLVLFIIITVLYFIPCDSEVSFSKYEIPDCSEDLKLPSNFILNNSERKFENQIKGPECFAVFNNRLFVSAHGGLVFEILGDTLIPVLKLKDSCDGFHAEKNCGRPLGITFDNSGALYLADAYSGILKANITTGHYETIFSIENDINGKKSKLPNSLVIAKDGSIYWTDSSSSNTLEDGFMILMTDGNGRVLKWDPKSRKNTVVMDGLVFANGIALSPNEDYLFVSETGRSRIHRIRLSNGKLGLKSIFLDRLPGFPDNLRINLKGNLIVSIMNPFYSQYNLMTILAPNPYLRRIAYNFLYSVDVLLEKMNQIYPHLIFDILKHKVGHLESFTFLTSNDILVLEVNMGGEIVKSYAGSDGSVTHLSDFIEFGQYYYLGSPYNAYLGRKLIPKSS